MQRTFLRVFLSFLSLATACQAAESIPVGFFARAPAISDVHVSADGRYLLYITSQTGEATLKTVDRQIGHVATISFGDAKEIEIAWCRWVRTRRIVCGLRRVSGWDHPGEITRLVGVDPTGANVRRLVDNGFGPVKVEHQVVSLGSPDDDSIIVQVVHFPPKVKLSEFTPRLELVRLDVATGALEMIAPANRAMPKAMEVIGDTSGEVLVARGIQGDSVVFWTRSRQENRWRELFRYRPLEAAPRPIPFAVIPKSQKAYALGPGVHHRALFELDLTNEHRDVLLYEAPDADVLGPMYASDGHVIGVTLDSDQPTVHYLESRDTALAANADKLLPDRLNQIVDVTPDKMVYVIRSSSDIDPGTYYLLDSTDSEHQLELIGSEYPELSQLTLARTRTTRVLAHDRNIRAFLTTPLDKRTLLAPTIIMPDGGPTGRASGDFNFLRSFLVSRGYAILQLQMDETTSARDEAARNTLNTDGYDGIASAARWAIDQRIADPARIAVMGWGYGGYLALLGAQRSPDLFRCAVAINGISDLTEWPSLEQFTGDDVSWLSGPSPRSEAKRPASPVLIVNGAHDAIVHPHHAVRLMRSYGMAGIEYEHLEIREGTYELREQTGRAQMLNRVEQFLKTKLQSPQADPATPPLFRTLE